MSEYLDFARDNIALFALLGAVIVAIVVTELRRLNKGFKDAHPLTAVTLINRDAQVIDVRSADAFRKAHLSSARNIPLAELADSTNRLDKDQTVLLYCDSGVTSAKAGSLLVAQGFKDVHHLAGGIGAWQRENLPVSKG